MASRGWEVETDVGSVVMCFQANLTGCGPQLLSAGGCGGGFWEPAGSPRPPGHPREGGPWGLAHGGLGWAWCPLPPPCHGLPCAGPGAGTHLPPSLWSPCPPMMAFTAVLDGRSAHC